ncbi:hypothetical protein BGZ70_006011 [Mortierella alpina]|uniref:Fanconi anemia group I protein n=1 Tax=Mortierella alpina TaxID=64518 RepID=A0A9P6M6A7_MORAP|nr:hypothetical protein BGZ70_006011 [Mortierella alpina]
MDNILHLYSQDTTGAALRHYFDEIDTSLESEDLISNLVVESLRAQESSYHSNEHGADCLLFVRAVLRASPEEGEGIARRSQVLKGSVSWLIQAGDQTDNPPGRAGSTNSQLDDVAGKLVNALIDVSQSFDQEALVQSIFTMTEVVRHRRHPHSQLFALFSRLLVIVANADSVAVPDSSETISGSEFRDLILDRICTAPWNPKSVLPLATVFADVEIESKKLEPVIVKIMKQFKAIDAADLPVLIYNLLLLSSRGHQRLVLRGTSEFFDRLNAGGLLAESLRSENTRGAAHLGFSELSVIESTVILHFSFAVKQDQELGTALLKHMKSGKATYLSSFSLACLMTMARIHRFEDSVMDYLKSSVLSVFKDQERMQREPWVTVFDDMSTPPLLEMFCDIIRKIPFDLEQLTPSIVQCGVHIMDSTAPTSFWKATDKEISKKSTPKSPNELACNLGATILAETFKAQVSARSEILDHIMSRIVTKSASTVFFLELLETIVKDSSEALEEHLPRIKESLDYLSFLSLTTAVRLMAAVKDVAKTKRSFRDSLILILRKALFSKNLESRQVALSGFLLLLQPSAKQAQSPRGGPSRIGAQHGLESDLSGYVMEILGMLRRCLGQQGEVRLSLYIGLMGIVETAPHLNPIIFEILQAHFVHFYDQTNTRLTPLMLEECVANSKTGGEPTFIEPLHYLMSGVVRSFIGIQKQKRRASLSHDDISVDEHQLAKCQRDLDAIVLGLERAGLEDFELDKTSDFNMATNIGARNNMYATLLTGCYEAAIEYVVLKQQLQVESSVAYGKSTVNQRSRIVDHHHHSPSLSSGSADIILHLFGKMRKLHDIVKERVVMQRGKKMGPLGEASVLGLECVTRLMEYMFVQEEPGQAPDAEALRLRGDDEFTYYISNVAHMSLSKLHTSSDVPKDSDYDFCRRLSSVLVREFIVSEKANSPKALAAGARGKDKNKSWLMVGIEAITAGLLTVQRFFAVDSSELISNSPRCTTGSAAGLLQNRKIISSFLAATLPQVNGGHREDQQASEVVAWTTSRTIRSDMDSLAAAYIQHLQHLFVDFVNETIPLLKEAAGLLGIIHILSKYLTRTRANDIAMQISRPAMSRSSSVSDASMDTGDTDHLDQLVQWLVKLCRDQAIDDAALTKTLLSILLQLEQECASPQACANLLASPVSNVHSVGEPLRRSGASLAFGSVSASSVISHCPEAATRLRLAGDILLTYGMNCSPPHVPSLRDLPDVIPPGQDVDDEIARLIQLKREIGTDAKFSVVTLRTSGAVTDVLLQQVDRSLEGLEWALSKLRYCGLGHPGSEDRCTKQQTTTHDRAQQQRGTGQQPIGDMDGPSLSSDPHASCPIDSCKVQKKPFQDFEAEICWRFEICLWILVRIAQACINQATSEHLIRVLQRCYKSLAALTKYYLTPPSVSPLNIFPSVSSNLLSSHAAKSTTTGGNQRRGPGPNGVIQLPHGFLRVTQVAGLELSKYLYSFLSYFHVLDEEQKARAQDRQGGGGGQKGLKKNEGPKGNKDNAADVAGAKAGGALGGAGGRGGFKSRQKAKILRESKLIPTLIFGVEQYERYVIQLSKKAKVNLTQFMRRSTARDFRIQIQRLGDLGLEDQYDEERQLLQIQQQQQQQIVEQGGAGQLGGDTHMISDHDEAQHQQGNGGEDEEEEDEEEESLVRSYKRVKR